MRGRWGLLGGTVLLAGGLAGCVQAEQSFGPDGRVAHAIKCGGAALTWADCYRLALMFCLRS